MFLGRGTLFHFPTFLGWSQFQISACSIWYEVLNYVVLVLGNEGGGPHHMLGYHHTWDLGIGLRKLVILILNIHQILK
jgi:hypothetical protein